MKKMLTLIAVIIFSTNIFSQELLVKSINDFSFKIYKATKPDSNNFFISPFSINVVLAISNEGAKASTREEIDNLLSIKNIKNRAFEYNKLISKTTNTFDSNFKYCYEWRGNKTNEILLANSLWINDNADVDSGFIKNINQNFNSEIFRFNEKNMISANKQLKDWVSKKTKDKITDINGLINDNKLSIVNAIYFMGEWDKPFKIKKTKRNKFYSLDNEKNDIKYMNNLSRYDYYEDSDIQCVSLPYKCSQFSMIVILPKEKFGIIEIETKLNRTYFKNIDSLSSFTNVKLSIPQFEIMSEIYLKDKIIEMGFPVMFSNKADFTGLSINDSLKIGEIIHKTFIKIDEKETEAAAITKSDIVVSGYSRGKGPLPPPKIFNANHPFIFMIVDNRTKAILFTGRYVKE